MWLHLKFEEKGAGLVPGAAWIVRGDFELTPDCTSIGELECRVKEMKADLDKILKQARHKFAACQGSNNA